MMRTAIFWDITQYVVIIPYRRFGITSRSRNVGKELPLFCVIAQNSSVPRLLCEVSLKSRKKNQVGISAVLVR